MAALLRLSRGIDWLNEKIGKNVAWLLLAAVLISTANAIIRKIFNSSSNAWLEAQWLLFGAVFLLCAPWTLLHNEHIRIDIVNSKLPQRGKRLIEFLGHGLFLIPMALVMIVTSYPFFKTSFLMNEQSSNAGGLPQWPAKFLILLGFILLLIQGISEFIKRMAVSQGLIPDSLGSGGHHAAAEAEAERLLEVAREEAEKAERARLAKDQ
ncbi:MAG TPA: TRAP transporter small permease subunit [Beijerinckiaceae bacterium]|nr:TRAP transporter small permease subunit [Beijerinckiaceae bacterium]